MTDVETRTYTVRGMTCEHCRAAVAGEVGEIAGVERVEVELERGLLEVAGRGIEDAAVASAVQEAGYELAPRA